jgi:hypothetical protein
MDLRWVLFVVRLRGLRIGEMMVEMIFVDVVLLMLFYTANKFGFVYSWCLLPLPSFNLNQTMQKVPVENAST